MGMFVCLKERDGLRVSADGRAMGIWWEGR